MQQSLLRVRYLGRQEYQYCWQKMREFTDQRNEDTLDECWIVEHPPVFTLGQAGKESHILNRSDIPIVKTDRGGQVTYHGPGQVMLYCLLNLKRKSIGVRDLVTHLEQTIINLLMANGISGERIEGAPGIYVEGAKISALGLRIRKGCCYHGLALNVSMDLTPFKQINPCGYVDMPVVNLNDLIDKKRLFSQVADELLSHFSQEFSYKIV